MDEIIIKGLKKLKGTVDISGSKNSALPILISTLLTDGKCVIGNVPDLRDITTTNALLEHLDKKIIRSFFMLNTIALRIEFCSIRVWLFSNQYFTITHHDKNTLFCAYVSTQYD